MGSHVISLRSAWRLGGALLIVIAITTLATAVLLDVDTGPGILALTLVAVIGGLLCLRILWERLDQRWLLAIPVIAVVQVALAVGLVDFVLTSLFLPVALYVALVSARNQTRRCTCLRQHRDRCVPARRLGTHGAARRSRSGPALAQGRAAKLLAVV
jgi:hypothetical protein